MIRITGIALFLSSTAACMAVPAFSHEFNGFRIEGQGGWDQYKPDLGYYGLQNEGWDAKKDGWVYGVEAGYDYRLNDRWILGIYGNYDWSSVGAKLSNDENANFSYTVKGDWSINGRAGFKVGNSTLLYIGGGYAQVSIDRHIRREYPALLYSDNNNLQGYRISVGMEQSFGDKFYGKLEYRYTNYYQGDLRNQVLVGLGIRFGQYVAPPPPPPPPPPPAPMAAPLPPCPPAAATPGPFLVFFDWDKAALSADATAILDRAVEQYQTTGQTTVALVGHTDTSGTPDYNMGLSQRRADAVKAYMVGKGVPDSAATASGTGETELLVQTADGVREPQNRRVEITFGGAAAPTSTGPCTPQ
jgi:OmpA-OmpF porin, OOP family